MANEREKTTGAGVKTSDVRSNVKLALKKEVDHFRPLWPQLLVTAMGIAGTIGLSFVHHFTTLVISGIGYRSYPFFYLMIGQLGSNASNVAIGAFNPLLAAVFVFLLLGAILPLFGKRGSKGVLVFSTVVYAIGILALLVANSFYVLKWGINPSLRSSVDVSNGYFGLGYGLLAAHVLINVFLPYVADAVSAEIGLRKFEKDVAVGHKMASF